MTTIFQWNTEFIIERPRLLKTSSSLKIKSMISKIFLFHSQCVQLRSAIYPALIGLSFGVIWETFCRNPFRKPLKLIEKKARFPLDFLISNHETWTCLRSFPNRSILAIKVGDLGQRFVLENGYQELLRTIGLHKNC